MNLDAEGKEYFLKLVKQHPSLYDASDEYFGDEQMVKLALGQIALCTCLEKDEAIKLWKELQDNFKEEEALRGAELLVGMNDSGAVDRQNFAHYNTMKEMYNSSSQPSDAGRPTAIWKKKQQPAAVKSKKLQLVKCAKKAKENCQQAQQCLDSAVQRHKSDPNNSVGEIILGELQLLGPKMSAVKRKQLYACLNDQESLFE